MAKNNIDNSVIRVGIDLGTTNSEIAICPSGNVDIIKNSLSDEFTPSVFGYDKLGNKIVGKHALKKIASFREEDIDNVKREVKRLMGTGEKVGFSYAGKKMLPEEISAEILKSLRDDVLRNNPDINLKSAIITVPAYFDSVQNEATVRAGNLAGFEQVTLLQEPIAAAMAYGFNRSIDANWLVYDFGGGTFDVALISSTDGMLKVIEHGGNNFLGGKDIDAAIVDEVIKPELLSRYKIKSFSKVVDEKLKVIAEDTKKMLTGSNEVSIEVDNIGEDDSGEEIYASLTLDRARFNSIIKPIIDKTIEIAKEVIEKSSIKAGSVSKIILVGGPTQIPYLRERLSEEMRIELETSIDPLTIVARGACIYGLGQRVSEDIVEEEYTNNSNEAYRVELNYEAMTSNDSEVLTGTIAGLPQGEYYVRINSEDGNYNSTTITVKKNGSFYDSLIIAPGKANRFWIYLTDANGNNVPIYPDNFTITHGLTVRGVPIPHGIGVIYGKKTSSGDFVEACDEYFARGDILPLEKTKSYTTIRPLHKNGDNELPIEVYEGDYVEPHSNKIITNVLIDGSKLPHDLPKGTDLDLTITISQSREVGVEVYIPSVDLELNARVMIFAEKVTGKDIERSIKEERKRVDDLNISESDKDEIKKELREAERDIQERDDTDNRQKVSNEVDRIRNHISELSSESKKEGALRRYNEKLSDVEEKLKALKSEDASTASEIEDDLEDLKRQGARAEKDNNMGELEYLTGELSKIDIRILSASPTFWITMYYQLKAMPTTSYSNPMRAGELLRDAENAVNNRNLEGLRSSCAELVRMLPEDERGSISEIQAGITR